MSKIPSPWEPLNHLREGSKAHFHKWCASRPAAQRILRVRIERQ